MKATEIHLHLVASEPGRSLAMAVRAAQSLDPDVHVAEHLYPLLRSNSQVEAILSEVQQNPGILLYSLDDERMIRHLAESCRAIGCPVLPLPSPEPRSRKIESEPVFASALRLQRAPTPRTAFGIGSTILAVVLGLLGLWMLATDLMSPAGIFSPVSFSPERIEPGKAQNAEAAAVMGAVRGDLWFNYAAMLADDTLKQIKVGGMITSARSIDPARRANSRAAELAPHNSAIWLMMAALDAQVPRYSSYVVPELKTSYYTGPNEMALRPMRIRVATIDKSINDPELRALVSQDIRTIVAHEPDLIPSIISAYRLASADGKRFLLGIAGEVSKTLLHSLEAEQ